MRTREKASGRDLYKVNPQARNKLDKEKDTWYAVGELAKGRTYKEIAEGIAERSGYTISVSQLRSDLEDVLVEWKRENMDHIDAYIAKELARLEELEAVALRNFEQSKLPSPQEYAAMLKRGYDATDTDAIYAERGGRAGDPRYLDTLLRIQSQRFKLLGVDKGNDAGANTIVNYNLSSTSLDDLAKLADSLQDDKLKELTIDNQ